MDNRVMGKLNENEEFAVESSTSGSFKRGRTPGNGIQVASCLVDGCNSDLTKCRDYHRRHKVCELHSKTPKVTVRGQEQRFCQQCSRFHSLEEFDEGKRSCRKRLDGHNRRRRKPQPEPLHMTSARFLADFQGTRFLAFDHPPQVLSCGWGGPIFKFYGRNESNGESLSVQGQGQRQRQFSFLEGTKSTFHGYSENAGGSNQKALSDCAHSLLSSTQPETREAAGLRHTMTMQPNAIPPSLHLDALGLVSQTHNTNLNCQGMFDIGSHSSSTAAHHKLFSWE